MHAEQETIKRSVYRELQRLSLRSSTQVVRSFKHIGKVDDFHKPMRNKSQASELTALGKAYFSRKHLLHKRLNGHFARAHSLHLHLSTWLPPASNVQLRPTSRAKHSTTFQLAKNPPLWSGPRNQTFQHQPPPRAVRCHPALPSVPRGGSRCPSRRPTSR